MKMVLVVKQKNTYYSLMLPNMISGSKDMFNNGLYTILIILYVPSFFDLCHQPPIPPPIYVIVSASN